jgi:hypothetical protein
MSGGYRRVLADRGNVVLAVLNVSCTILITTPLLALPLYVLERFPGSLWLPGALSAVVSVVLALLVTVAPRISYGHRRLLILALSAAVWAASSIFFALAALPPGMTGVGLMFAGALALGIAGAGYSPTADALPLFLAPEGFSGRYTALHQLAWGRRQRGQSVAGVDLVGPFAVRDLDHAGRARPGHGRVVRPLRPATGRTGRAGRKDRTAPTRRPTAAPFRNRGPVDLITGTREPAAAAGSPSVPSTPGSAVRRTRPGPARGHRPDWRSRADAG